MEIQLEAVHPADIEARSFAILSAELEERGITLDPEQAPVIKRCIHTSADFDYARNLVFTDGAIARALEALRRGAVIVTDTRMAQAGINKRVLERLGGEALCFMADADVAQRAQETGTTRAAASMDKAMELARTSGRPFLYAIGNAPTALVRLAEQIEQGRIRPALVIGVPVGFVNVVQAKELLLQTGAPSIVARGRKGGSSIAACICNALLYQLDADRG